MSGIGIVTNPHSKLNKRNPRRKALLGYIVGEHGRLEITNTLEELAQVARRFKERGVEVLAINGGDGTVSRTLTAFVNEYSDTPLPRVAILGGGTINVLRNNLGIRGTPEQILYRLTEIYSEGQEIPVRRLGTLSIDGQIGFLFGNGAAANFLREYYKRKSGPIGAAFWVFRVWASRFYGGKLYDTVVRDEPYVLKPADGPEIRHRSCAVFASTVERMPLGYRLFGEIREDPSRFQVVSFTFAAREAVWQVPLTLLKKEEGTTRGKLSLTTMSLAVQGPEEQGPFDYTLDGELFRSSSERLEIGMGPTIDFLLI